MATVADLLVKIGADTSDLRKKLNASKRQIRSAFGSEMIEASKSAATGLLALNAAIAAGGIAAVKLAGEYQQVEAALTNMLGSADKAKSLLSDLQSFAASTPFELKGVTKATQKLLAFGFTAEQIIPTLTAIGDAATGVGGGQEAIDHITLAIGQMAAKNQVMSQEMMQLTEQGIPAWKMLADYLKTDVAGAMNMVEKRQVDAATGITALIQGMNSQYGGMMEQQSGTIQGSFSNMMDGLEQMAIQTGLSIADALDLTDVFASMGDAMSSFAKEIQTNGIRAALDNLIPPGLQLVILSLAGAIIGALVPGLIALGAAAAAALLPLLPYIAAGAVIGAALYIVVDAVESLSETLDGADISISGFIDWIESTFDPLAFCGNAIDSLSEIMGLDMEDMLSNARTWAEGLIQEIDNTISGFMDMAYDALPEWAKESLSVIGNMVNTAIDWLSELAAYAQNVLDKIKTNMALASKYASGEISVEEGYSAVDTSGNNAADFYALDQQTVQDMAPRNKKHVYAEPFGGAKKVPDYSQFASAKKGEATGVASSGGGSRASSSRENGAKSTTPKIQKETSAIQEFHRAVSEAKSSGDREALEKLMTPENAALLKNEKDMSDAYQEWADKAIGMERKITEAKSQEKLFREALDEAYRQNNLATFASLMTEENAVMMAAYNERQTLMQNYYEAWQAAHITTTEMLANAIAASTQNFADFFTNILTGAKTFGEAFTSLFTGIFENIIKQIAAKWANQITQKLLGTMIDKNNLQQAASAEKAAKAEASKSSAMAANATAAVIAAKPHMVWGAGLLVAGQMALAKSAAGAIKMATGGFVSGPGTATSDSIPAMLSDGEFVMNAKAVREVGLSNLMNMNEGKPIHLATGGPVGDVSAVSVRSLPTKNTAPSNPGMTQPSKNVTLEIHALDADSFRDFLRNSGGDVIRQMLYDMNRDYTSESGVW